MNIPVIAAGGTLLNSWLGICECSQSNTIDVWDNKVYEILSDHFKLPFSYLFILKRWLLLICTIILNWLCL